MLEHSCRCIFCVELILFCLISKENSSSFEKDSKCLINKKKEKEKPCFHCFWPKGPSLLAFSLLGRLAISFLQAQRSCRPSPPSWAEAKAQPRAAAAFFFLVPPTAGAAPFFLLRLGNEPGFIPNRTPSSRVWPFAPPVSPI